MAWNVQILADSVNECNVRITSYLLTYPRFIHSELMTHRVFSRNAASSRAIPIERMIRAVEEDPAMPIRWGSNGPGMQDHGVLAPDQQEQAITAWRMCASEAVNSAKMLMEVGLHKQVVNRVLEPFMWMTTLVTATDYDNFFKLRVHPAAQPEFQHLAHQMLKAYVASRPAKLTNGQWHMPFHFTGDDNDRLVRATAACARVSYTNHGKTTTLDEDRVLHDRLAKHGHWSPFEHCACAKEITAKTGNAFDSNFNRSWMQYRKFFSGENQYVLYGYDTLLNEYEAAFKEPT